MSHFAIYTVATVPTLMGTMASPRRAESQMALNISRIRRDVSVIKSGREDSKHFGNSILVESLGLITGLQEVAATFKVIDHINNPTGGQSFVRREGFFKSKSHMVMSAAVAYSIFYLARQTKSASEVFNYDYREFLHQICCVT
uniref:Uncharacterized protein n=1 Tax=Oryza glumipatula TaxID=40148 RepID=A0A0D9YMP4_9ORYZ